VEQDSVRVNVVLARSDLELLDRLAAATGKSRSALIREALRAYRPAPAPAPPAGREEALRLLETVRVRFPVDPVALIRGMREGRRAW
jgi:hypothetical protein